MLKRLELLIPPPIVALLTALAIWGVARAFPDWVFAFPFQAAVGYTLIAIGIGLEPGSRLID